MSGMNCKIERLVRLWLVVEEDRGMGATVCSGHATETEANEAAQGGHEYVEWVDIPWSRLEALKPNDQVERTQKASKGENDDSGKN